MTFHNIKRVVPQNDNVLLVDFCDGKSKRYDTKQLFDIFPIFISLQNVNGLFEQVKVDTKGYGISWNDELDISCNELYDNGVDTNKYV